MLKEYTHEVYSLSDDMLPEISPYATQREKIDSIHSIETSLRAHSCRIVILYPSSLCAFTIVEILLESFHNTQHRLQVAQVQNLALVLT